MRSTAGLTRFGGVLIAALLLTPGAAAGFGDDGVVDEPLQAPLQEFPDPSERQILMTADGPVPDDGEPFRDRFHFNVKRGVEYRQEVPLGNSNFLLELYGPVIKKKPGLGFREPGLGFRVTGSVGKYPVLIKGYGDAKKQRVTFRIDFF
jgi:hypothetical protein